MHDIDEGVTNAYLIHGVFVVIAAGIAFLAHWSLTVLGFAIAVMLFRVRSGVEIDVRGRRARAYKAILKWRSGEWIACKDLVRIRIRYTQASQVMNSRFSTTNVRAKTYDLMMIEGSGEERMFHDFTDYAKARKAAEIMANGWICSLADEVQQMRQRSREHETDRRR